MVILVADATAGLFVEPFLPPRKLLISPSTNSDTPGLGLVGSDLSVKTPL
jgi:hypothetical protein